MLLLVTYSQAARNSLRNVCRTHEESVVRGFGRAALFEATEHGAFLALRLREKHPEDVQIERTEPFNEFREVREAVRVAARAYECRECPSTPYAKFAVDSPHPTPEELRTREL
ncbi:hypothetical protein KM295_12575 [Natronomonas sp. F2-12]|uniref:Uncharacterized protein n=1 Tax=Natronomonas aquatica TaxID=2841590 RepID=A0A9R1CVC3_9EURY|nr:hypothetical protein [Natronomonas aquatica]